MLSKFLSEMPFFGVFLTAITYVIGIWVQKQCKVKIFNPLIIAGALVIVILLLTGVDYDIFLYGRVKAGGIHDGTGAAMFQNLLTPATVCLAVPLYEKISYLKKYPLAILGGILSGILACLISILLLSMLFGIGHTMYVSLLPKSITTAMGMGVCEELGGMTPVIVAAINITGIFGYIVASSVFKLLKIEEPMARGLACGTSAHAVGTARARELGKTEEAMSGLSIAVAGIITVILAPLFASLY